MDAQNAEHLPIARRAGYLFLGWVDIEGAPYSLENVTHEKTYYALWQPCTDIPYTIRHYQMNTDGHGYTLAEEERMLGTTDTEIAPEVKTYTGFLSPGTQNTVINGDGSTVVNYYYERKKYTVNLLKAEGSVGIRTMSGSGSYYYDSPVAIHITAMPGYETALLGDRNETAFRMPARNLNFTVSGNYLPYVMINSTQKQSLCAKKVSGTVGNSQIKVNYSHLLNWTAYLADGTCYSYGGAHFYLYRLENDSYGVGYRMYFCVETGRGYLVSVNI